MIKLIIKTTIEKYIMNRPCFWYNGVSFLAKTSIAPYTKPTIGINNAIM